MISLTVRGIQLKCDRGTITRYMRLRPREEIPTTNVDTYDLRFSQKVLLSAQDQGFRMWGKEILIALVPGKFSDDKGLRLI